MGVGSRVILNKISNSNMVEVECPLCAETVVLGSDTTGTYECPYCNDDFEYYWVKGSKQYQLDFRRIPLYFFLFVIVTFVISVILVLLGVRTDPDGRGG